MRKRKDQKFAERISRKVDELGECPNVVYAEGDMRIGEMLETWRIVHKKKATDIANEIGINVSTMRRLEAGKQHPDFATGMRIMIWLFSEEKNGASESTSRTENNDSSSEQGERVENLSGGGY